jgi:predicted dithiol-disulfide oxidoreductase (DUF899 family)
MSLNYDFHVSFTKEELATGKIYYNYATIDDEKYLFDELPGLSVFYKDSTATSFTPIPATRAATRR